MRCLSAIILCLVFAVGAVAEEEGFVSLFDGESLEGWEIHGGQATYDVEEGTIVGRVKPNTPGNTFLCTKKPYGNFIFKVGLKLDSPMNSGIQIRSHVREEGDRVFGYQCEVDPSARAWSGGIYDEARRGWLYPLSGDDEAKRQARAAFKPEDWNEYTIEAVGPTIKTWVNGVPCADLVDFADLEGLIALQVHAGGSPGVIRWKNVRIKDLGKSEWKPLFDGKDLSQWEPLGGGEWTVEDGMIRGTSKAESAVHGILCSKQEYGDFAIRLKYKPVRGNSGLYFRTEKSGDDVVVHGFQAEINPNDDPGSLYETAGRAWVSRVPAEVSKEVFKPGDWNEMIVVAQGKDITVFINGKEVTRLRNDPGRTRGFLGLQLHGGEDMEIYFDDIEIMEL